MSNTPCGCNDAVPPCNPSLPQQESVASQLQNLMTTLFGAFTVTVINGRATWSQVCSANTAIPGFPMNPGEGFICYMLRVLLVLRGAIQQTPYASSIAQAKAVATLNTLPPGSLVGIMNAVNAGELSFYQFLLSVTPPAENLPMIFHPTDNPTGAYFILVS